MHIKKKHWGFFELWWYQRIPGKFCGDREFLGVLFILSPLPLPTQSLPHFLLWVLEDSKSSLDSEQIWMELPADLFIYYFCYLWFVCMTPEGWGAFLRGTAPFPSRASLSAAGDHHSILCRFTTNRAGALATPWKPRESKFYFILFFGPDVVLCPRAPSSGSPLLRAELNSAARGRWWGGVKAAEAVPGGTFAVISHLKTPKLSLNHLHLLWHDLLTCSLLAEPGRVFRIPHDSWLTLGTSL